jgi:hypothetical protein
LQTGTSVFVLRDGKIVDLTKQKPARSLVKNYLSKRSRCGAVKSLAKVLIALHGSLLDELGEGQIVDQIKKARKNSKDLAAGF